MWFTVVFKFKILNKECRPYIKRTGCFYSVFIRLAFETFSFIHKAINWIIEQGYKIHKLTKYLNTQFRQLN